jgi:3-oxoacyl-[acyl-carrier-protein] synthase III
MQSNEQDVCGSQYRQKSSSMQEYGNTISADFAIKLNRGRETKGHRKGEKLLSQNKRRKHRE